MQPNLLIVFTCLIFFPGALQQPMVSYSSDSFSSRTHNNPYRTIAEIPMPAGYSRVALEPGSFGAWLRDVRLKEEMVVYLYNGNRKINQRAQFSVLDISTGNRDLQQCADAVIRIRAEYLYEQKRYGEIVFLDNNGTRYSLPLGADRKKFNAYLEKVFIRCGTLSLERQLKRVAVMNTIMPGDVFIKGGSPGHAAIVMDVAMNSRGEKIFLLANGYMPAQDIHVVINPRVPGLSPWYSTDYDSIVELPEYRFASNQLKHW